MKSARSGETNAGKCYRSILVRCDAITKSKHFTETSKEDRLGLLIEPAQVRLVPGLNDPYCWRYPPHLRQFSTRNMSNQTVGVYKALCREVKVKKSIKAVARDSLAELGAWETSEDEMSERVWNFAPLGGAAPD